MGLVSRVVPHAELEEAVQETIHLVKQTAPRARTLLKRDLNRQLPRIDHEMFAESLRGPEVMEGFAAFVGKLPLMLLTQLREFRRDAFAALLLFCLKLRPGVVERRRFLRELLRLGIACGAPLRLFGVKRAETCRGLVGDAGELFVAIVLEVLACEDERLLSRRQSARLLDPQITQFGLGGAADRFPFRLLLLERGRIRAAKGCALRRLAS